ncbi:hypothetical protein Vadar_014701 [Vaccinium darrowii]|uniref:Uncharacterized protein n=1 Tax=Vaccinium darrowii TaxID=229202 RepID=A0ACB7XHG9_9ERIC|nr:hypothetical protein Vadar_014701 [Vaccinium darrowii]
MSLSPPPLSFLLSLLLFLTSLLSTPSPSSAAAATISNFSISLSPWRPSQTRTLLSPNSTFAAGFLPLPTSPNLFTFSIWYNHHNSSTTTTSTLNPTVIWSANQTYPVTASASLIITPSGDLRLLENSSGRNLWLSSPASDSNSTKLSLTDKGELVFGNWSSFDVPTDTIVANQTMSSGKTVYSRNGKFEFVNSSYLVFNGSDRYKTLKFNFQILQENGKVEAPENGGSLITSDFGANRQRRITLDNDGNLRIYSYDPDLGQWVIVWEAIQELCQIHGTCGPNAICMTDGVKNPFCVCPPGFSGDANSTAGCQRKIRMTGSTKFIRLDYVDFSSGSNHSNQKVINDKNFTSCQGSCLSDPKCVGFGVKYNGSGYCVLQLERLLNGYWSPGTELAMFLRVDSSEPDDLRFTGLTDVMETTCPVQISLPLPPKDSDTTTRNIVIVSTLFAAELVSGVLFFWAFVKKYIKYRDMARTLGLEFLPAGGPKRFSYAELKDATDNFSNIIGTGAFGDVFKGELSDHRVVAVKCLKNVAGGDAEFWAEVTIIARMHHLNLVRLWGFCAEKGQRILVYEYVPNGSLDKFLFPRDREGSENMGSIGETHVDDKPLLDWNIRNLENQGSKLGSEAWYFPTWAFEKVFKEMRVEDILDSHIKHCYNSQAHFDMVDRMVKTAMWCLQDRAEMRPSMGKVAKMLEGTVEITEPKKPTIFYLGDE